MGIFDFFKKPEPAPAPKQTRSIVFPDGTPFSWGVKNFEPGYTPLSKCPEIITGCSRIANLISSMTIYLMANTERGDVRIKNELSRTIDIHPNRWMTRATWMTGIVMNMLLYGRGNAVVVPHTSQGYLGSLEPIAMDRVDFEARENGGYRILIDNKPYNPDNLLHFVHNPHPRRLWKGQGYTVALGNVANSLAQANATKQGFMRSEWKPSLVVKVDALADEFSGRAGREKLLDDYITTSGAGQPWVVPADAISIDQVRPLSLQDLAIDSTVRMDKQTVASILGVPPYLMGVGEFHQDEWNAFINNTIRPICREIEQEMTRKLILSEKWYLMFNIASLYSYDLQATATVYQGLMEHGIVTGNEVREKIGMEPKDGLDELLVLENYIPVAKSGDQAKLN